MKKRVGRITPELRRTSTCEECGKVYVCAQCRTQKPMDNRGFVATPIGAIVTLWGAGQDRRRHQRRVKAAEGYSFSDGQISLQFFTGDGPPWRVEHFISMRTLVAKHGADFEVIRREW